MKNSEAAVSFICSFNSAQFFYTFVAFSCIFISHATQKRDELCHAWLSELSRVNVINVHDYNAELQECLSYDIKGNTRFEQVLCACTVTCEDRARTDV